MNKKLLIPALVVGALAFVITFLLAVLIGTPYPLGAGLIVGFLIFELRYYMLWRHEKAKASL